MSRHRNIRNINITDELDDDALSDGGEEDMTPDQQARMNDGLEQVKLVIGGEEQSGFSDSSIRDALWEYYFDIQKTIEWALEEREKLQIAKERKGSDHVSDSSSDPYNENGAYQYSQNNRSGNLLDTEDGQDFNEADMRPRLPSIFLAQQQPGFDNQAYLAVPSSPRGNRLSTITERTERTEPSMLWRPRQHYMIPNTPRSFVSSDSTDYGRELDALSTDEHFHHQLDPNTSGASPSGSAIQRLSTYDPPPSNSSTVSPNDQSYPVTASEPRSSLNNIPSIPDFNSKSSDHASRYVPTPTHSLPNKSQSKLSKLASSRASTISTISESSKSSRSSGTAATGSIKTFPALRQSAQSERPLSSAYSSKGSVASSKELPPIPSHISSSSIQSSTSSIVRRAIQTAMELEAVDKETPKSSRPQSILSEESDRAKTPTPSDQKTSQGSPTDLPSSPSKNRPLSKLAILAQQKAEAANKSLPSLEMTSLSETSQSSQPRPLSKLAMLAQQKVDASRVPKLPKTITEYLTPIANGSSVTTAITTSYQSLYSLTDPSRHSIIPRLNIVPLQSPGGASASPSDPKPSKLAMKIKRAGEKPLPSPGFPSEEDISPSMSPIFQPKSTHARASPSAFASVLIHDNIISPQDKSKDKDVRRRKKERKHKRDAELPAHRLLEKGRSSRDTLPAQETGSYSTFAFDNLSPDDIVLNARKRTTPGLKALASASTPRGSVGTGKSQFTN
ncbi:hypothetical protein GALMADRAFT_150559 [Galerina marginata CBS 339.88]|uniref:HBS1-like protein N-terminal domain-containing protein n=1 Tax=Galerina marginata (strain CBS 339.88) TaxID=685588 RepID=A0A067TWT5_GALM3|nr:hypothetical protein GALMADRAFT_150559 [Galerina marginata CBS 339.88]